MDQVRKKKKRFVNPTKEVASHVANWGKIIADREKSTYKGPEVEIPLQYCGTSKEASAPEHSEQGERCSRWNHMWSQRNSGRQDKAGISSLIIMEP